MTEQQVRKVVVAGGGTAGWCAAAAIARQLGALVEVVLVESDAIGTVGVGEATIPTIRTFHQFLGIDEREFMRATQATFKLGIAFENWAREGDRYIHSFGEVGRSTWMGGFQHFWLHGREEGIAGPLGDYCFELQAAERGRFATGDGATLNYAYHLDATAYGRFLRTIGESSGVRRIEGRIRRVERDSESGLITALALESGERVAGDLFIDCTGFRSLLIEDALQTGFDDWSHWLPTDRALAVQTQPTGPALPYTRAIAHAGGWRWRIPLQERIGNGLVYSSAHMEDSAAHDLLLGAIDAEPTSDPRLIAYRTGQRRKAWNANCVALGLSSGFVEPLESTSIHLIMIGVTRLLQLFPFAGVTPALRDRFNDLARRELEAVRDFIILHYHLTERTDSSFWEHCRTMDIPDTLASRIELFREGAQAYQASDELFRVDSWLQVMLGQRLDPQGYHHMGQIMPRERLRDVLDGLRADIAAAVDAMPAHEEFLRGYCGDRIA
ncbi:tryptophan halogenase family protein [Stakelama marina]|uniref:Tryptophan 7-halogenase n=1 Tax=Stakelama marina TaxID=2826939 RepID=A0A8T4IIL6_9SPHN|nr:tryptophan 7-halogenase [Stakelama marina]MBR0552036.1 tryptophan 7-halogenase [Stakelama marina]